MTTMTVPATHVQVVNGVAAGIWTFNAFWSVETDFVPMTILAFIMALLHVANGLRMGAVALEVRDGKKSEALKWKAPAELTDTDAEWLRRHMNIVTDLEATEAEVKAIVSSAEQAKELEASKTKTPLESLMGYKPGGIVTGPAGVYATAQRGVYKMPECPKDERPTWRQDNHTCEQLSDGRCIKCGWDWKKWTYDKYAEQGVDPAPEKAPEECVCPACLETVDKGQAAWGAKGECVACWARMSNTWTIRDSAR